MVREKGIKEQFGQIDFLSKMYVAKLTIKRTMSTMDILNGVRLANAVQFEQTAITCDKKLWIPLKIVNCDTALFIVNCVICTLDTVNWPNCSLTHKEEMDSKPSLKAHKNMDVVVNWALHHKKRRVIQMCDPKLAYKWSYSQL